MPRASVPARAAAQSLKVVHRVYVPFRPGLRSLFSCDLGGRRQVGVVASRGVGHAVIDRVDLIIGGNSENVIWT